MILFQSHLSQWTGKQQNCLSVRPLGPASQPSLVLLSSMCLDPFRVRKLPFVPASFKILELGHCDSHSYLTVVQWTSRSFRGWWQSLHSTAAVTILYHHHHPPPLLSWAEWFLGLSAVPSSLVRNTFYSIKTLCIFFPLIICSLSHTVSKWFWSFFWKSKAIEKCGFKSIPWFLTFSSSLCLFVFYEGCFQQGKPCCTGHVSFSLIFNDCR